MDQIAGQIVKKPRLFAFPYENVKLGMGSYIGNGYRKIFREEFSYKSLKQQQTSRMIAISIVLLGCFSTQAIANAPVQIMPLGDSITYGVGATSSNGYRKPLYLSLTSASYNFDFVGSQTTGDFPDPNHEGHPGWQADTTGTNDILGQVYNWLTSYPADIVLLHIGTNDITVSGQDANEVSNILDEIDRFSTDIKVVLALIIDRVPHSQVTTEFNIDVNNMAQSRISAGDDIVIVNMENALNYTTDMYDSLHPNNSGYAKMADVWFNALDSIINPPLVVSEPITNATIFQMYSYDVDVDANCYPEPTYTLTVCPNDMTIDHNTGLIEWLPTAVGDFNVTVEVSNGQLPDANQSFVITVIPAISHIGDIGTVADKTTGTSLVIQTTVDVNAGDDIIIAYATYGDPSYQISVADDAGNNYVEVAQAICYQHGRTYIFAAYDVNALSSSSDITITHTEVEARAAVASVFRGLVDVNVLDQSLGNPAAGAQEAISGTVAHVGPAGTTTQANELLIGAIGTEGPVEDNAGIWQYSFTAGQRDGTTGGGSEPDWTVSMGWRIVSETGEYTAEVNGITDRYWAAAIATFKGESGPSRVISGYIFEPNAAPVEGVLIDANSSGSSDITDSNGYYELLVSYGWSGTITPDKNEHLFAPSKQTYSNVITDLLDQNYTDISIYDLDGNDSIGWGDVWIICDNWLATGPDIPGDIYKDEYNIVDFLDFAEFAHVW